MGRGKFRTFLIVGVSLLAASAIVGTGFSAWYFQDQDLKDESLVSVNVTNYTDLDEISWDFDYPDHLAIEDPSLTDLSYEKNYGYMKVNGEDSPTGMVFLKEQTISNLKTTDGTSASLLTSIDPRLNITLSTNSDYKGEVITNDLLHLYFGIKVEILHGSTTIDATKYFKVNSGTNYDFGYDASNSKYGVNLFDTSNQSLLGNYSVTGLGNATTDSTTGVVSQTISISNFDLRYALSFSDSLKSALSNLNNDTNLEYVRDALREVSEYGWGNNTYSGGTSASSRGGLLLNKVKLNFYLTLTRY